MKKRSKKIAIGVSAGVLVLAVAAVLIVPRMAASRAAAAAGGAVETFALAKSNLTQSISVSGVVETAQTTSVYSTLNYPVKEILVAEGDTVEAGDVIAVLDTENLETDIAQAEINYGSARANAADSVTSAKNALASAKITLEQRQTALESAEKDLAQAKADARKPFDSATYDRAVSEAMTTLNRKSADASAALSDYTQARYFFDDYKYQNAITDAQLALDRKKADLANATDEKSAAAAKSAVEDAQRGLERAKEDLARAKEDAVKAAKDKLDAANHAQEDAHRAYNKALEDRSRALRDDGDGNGDKIENAEKALLDAQKQLESTEISVKNAENSLAQAQSKTGSGGTNVQLQELTLDKLARQLADGEIVAGTGGVITAVNAKVGAAPSGALFVIDNKDELYVSAKVKEYNLNDLAVGQEIWITTDATGDKKFSAALSYISPKAVSEAGSTSVEFEIRATLADPDEAVKIGMNAFLDIITGVRENVYVVPVSAVVTNERGSFVYALRSDGNEDFTRGMPEGFDPENMPEGFDPENMPEGFDPENMPEGFDPENMPEGFRQGGGRPSGTQDTTQQSGAQQRGAVVRGASNASERGASARIEIPVTTGLKTSTSVEIAGAGLRDGLQILVDPESKLSDGQASAGFAMMPFGGGRR